MISSSKPKHINWFKQTKSLLTTSDGIPIQIWEFHHAADDEVLDEWGDHFRNHYCCDTKLDRLKGRLSRAEYLNRIKFPNPNSSLGPGVRAGDFGEILVADFLEWILGFNVPRFRWASKINRDESPKGCDIVGLKFAHPKKASTEDELYVIEVKTKFSKNKINRMQDSIDGSAKDHLRIDESLNFLKQKYIDENDTEKEANVERFQTPTDIPYVEIFGAATVYTNECYAQSEPASANTKQIKTGKNGPVIPHPSRNNLNLFVFSGDQMMQLVNELYRRAANAA